MPRRTRRARFGLATVRGISMEPTLRDKDVLLIRYDDPPAPSPGALVVVRLPPDDDGRPRPIAVKRLVGRAPRSTPDVEPRGEPSGQPSGQPSGERCDAGWWVERDNPRAGVDSWTVGAIPDDGIVAVVLARLWPPWRRDRHRAG